MPRAVANVQQQSWQSGTSSVALSLSGVLPGSLVVAVVYGNNGNTPTAPAGWTEWAQGFTQNVLHRGIVFVKISAGGTESGTFSCSGAGRTDGSMFEFVGLEASLVTNLGQGALAVASDNGASATSKSSGAWTVPSAPPQPSQTLVMAVLITASNHSAVSVSGSGFALAAFPDSGRCAVAFGTFAPGAAATPTFTWTTSSQPAVFTNGLNAEADRDDGRQMLLGSSV